MRLMVTTDSRSDDNDRLFLVTETERMMFAVTNAGEDDGWDVMVMVMMIVGSDSYDFTGQNGQCKA